VALALVVAACGGDDTSDTTTTTTRPTTTTTAPTTTTSSTTTSSTTTTSTLDISAINPNISKDSKVTTAGLGPVRVGMNPQEANVAAGYDLAVANVFEGDSCYYLDAAPVLPGVAFMVNDGTIARVDVTAGSVSTRSGARIGMSAQEIKDLFPGQIEELPHQFTDGTYLIFVPRDEADKQFRVVWETDFNGTVLNYRSGRLPEVLWTEGCA
jgi:hypothetical protein